MTTSPGAVAQPSPITPAPMTPANAPQTAAQPVPASGPNFIQVQSSDMLSSNVVGLNIYNSQNNDIGKIQDIAFDSSKQVTGYILSVGGFLGMGTHYVAVNPGCGHGGLRRSEQGLEGDHERHQGPAQVGAGIQIRRPVDSQQKLSRRGPAERGSLPRSDLSNQQRRATMADRAADIDHVWKLIDDIAYCDGRHA